MESPTWMLSPPGIGVQGKHGNHSHMPHWTMNRAASLRNVQGLTRHRFRLQLQGLGHFRLPAKQKRDGPLSRLIAPTAPRSHHSRERRQWRGYRFPTPEPCPARSAGSVTPRAHSSTAPTTSSSVTPGNTGNSLTKGRTPHRRRSTLTGKCCDVDASGVCQ